MLSWFVEWRELVETKERKEASLTRPIYKRKGDAKELLFRIYSLFGPLDWRIFSRRVHCNKQEAAVEMESFIGGWIESNERLVRLRGAERRDKEIYYGVEGGRSAVHADICIRISLSCGSLTFPQSHLRTWKNTRRKWADEVDIICFIKKP